VREESWSARACGRRDRGQGERRGERWKVGVAFAGRGEERGMGFANISILIADSDIGCALDRALSPGLAHEGTLPWVWVRSGLWRFMVPGLEYIRVGLNVRGVCLRGCGAAQSRVVREKGWSGPYDGGRCNELAANMSICVMDSDIGRLPNRALGTSPLGVGPPWDLGV